MKKMQGYFGLTGGGLFDLGFLVCFGGVAFQLLGFFTLNSHRYSGLAFSLFSTHLNANSQKAGKESIKKQFEFSHIVIKSMNTSKDQLGWVYTTVFMLHLTFNLSDSVCHMLCYTFCHVFYLSWRQTGVLGASYFFSFLLLSFSTISTLAHTFCVYKNCILL